MNVRKAPSAKYSAISSACASMFSQMIMVPCETIKIQLQIFQKSRVKGQSPLMNSLRFIYRNEGIRGFWRGYFVSLACSMPSCAIYYSTFESLRKYCYTNWGDRKYVTPFIPAVTSSIGQIATCLITSPIDRFRTQYWANRDQKVMVLLKKTVAQVEKDGFFCLYHGLKPLLVRDICFSSIYWSVFEELHSYAEAHGLAPVWQNFFAASVGGMASSAIVTPFDLVKTRQQVLHTKENIFTSMKGIVKEEGVYGLFRGLTPRIAQTIPTMSVMMIFYDGINRLILKHQT